jgi:PAS domain-containing protein
MPEPAEKAEGEEKPEGEDDEDDFDDGAGPTVSAMEGELREGVMATLDAIAAEFDGFRRLQEKLMERRLDLLAKVFQASSEAILIVDAERRILTANGAFERHTGYSLQDVVGQRPDLLLPPTQLRHVT